METSGHRLDQFGESLGQTLRRLLLKAALASIGTLEWLLAGHFRRPRGDDILWDDGEPEEKS
jgi:hypothetical protein